MKNNYEIKQVKFEDVEEIIMKKHYLKRKPSSSTQYFGLYNKDKLIGCCSFSNSAPNKFLNNPKKKFGVDNVKVVELNRLWIVDNHEKNLTSWFVSNCISKLPKDRIIISYADPNNGHKGGVYKACNFIYNGKTNQTRTYKKDGKEYHQRSLYSKYGTNANGFLKEKGYEVIKNEGKNRYIFINTPKKLKNKIKSNILDI